MVTGTSRVAPLVYSFGSVASVMPPAYVNWGATRTPPTVYIATRIIAGIVEWLQSPKVLAAISGFLTFISRLLFSV